MRFNGIEAQLMRIVRGTSAANGPLQIGDKLLVWGSLSRLNGQDIVITGAENTFLNGVRCKIIGANPLDRWEDAIAEFILVVI